MYQYQQVARQKPRVRPIEVSPLHPHAEDQAITICDSCLGPALLDQAPLKLVRRGVETRTRYCERHGSIPERQEKAGARLEADGGGSLSLPPRPSLPSSSSLAPFRPAACNTGVRPTVYIVSFSTDLTPHTRALARLLALHLPVRDAPIPHVCTVDATAMEVPPADVCAAYSGVSRLVQECVMLDPRAREHTRRAVQDAERGCGRNRGSCECRVYGGYAPERGHGRGGRGGHTGSSEKRRVGRGDQGCGEACASNPGTKRCFLSLSRVESSRVESALSSYAIHTINYIFTTPSSHAARG
jgi:hypothetical protein